MKRYLFLLFLFFESVFAKNYEVNLILDKATSNYFESIKKEVKSLFNSDENLIYNLQICDKNQCEDLVNTNLNGVFLLKKEIKFEEKKNKYFITYNNISTIYDENRVLRATALAILEYVKENKKTKTLFLKNRLSQIKKEEVTLENIKIYELKEIFDFVLSNNLEVKQNQNENLLYGLDVQNAKNLYKPNIELFSNTTQIDSDRAKYSNGLYSEGSVDAGIKITQVIYSNKIIQNIKIKKLLDESNKNKTKAKNDENLYKALLTYLNIIKAKKFNEIISIKHEFIEQNLEFSKQRVEIGVQDRSDFYRWQSELANVNIELSNSKKELENLKIELSNLILVDKNFDLENYGMHSKLFKLLNQDAIKYIANENVQKLFLENIIYSHYSLRQLEDLISAKNEEYQMNKNSRYLPSIVFEAQAKKIVDRFGEASDFTRPWNDNEFQAVLNFNFPLYEGGTKSINIQKDEIELVNLKLKYNEVKNLIEKNVKQNYFSLKKSYEDIDYSNTSLEFSKKNYELVLDKYKNGKENIISLLDAQNAYIVSKINENISIVDYLVDLSSILFLSGNIEILVDEDKKSEFEKDILRVTNEK